MRPARRQRISGFTLGELLVTLLVVAVVATIAMPSYRTIIRNARLMTQIYDFDAALNLARSEAVKRGYPVTVCPSTNGTSCATSTQWEQGWIVFVDVNSNQTVDTATDSREVILRTTPALVSGYTLRGSSSFLDATSSYSYLTINPKGQASATGQFVLCENLTTPNPSRAVLVNTVGRIAIAADDNGYPVDANGSDITNCTPS